jgi:hypothetical protein
MSSQSSLYCSADEYIEFEQEQEPMHPSSQLLNSLDENPFNNDSSYNNPFENKAFDNKAFDDNLESDLELMPLPPKSTYDSKNAMWHSIQT